MIPIIKAKAPSPGTLKIGLIMGFNIFPIKGTINVDFRSSVATKKGRSDGTMELAQSAKPDFELEIFELGNITISMINTKKMIGRINFLIFTTKKLCMKSPIYYYEIK